MGVPANVTKDLNAPGTLMLEQLRVQMNNIVASLRLLTAKLDADAGVTDANYNALITDDAIATAPAKIVP
jgi:hypothetical protein